MDSDNFQGSGFLSDALDPKDLDLIGFDLESFRARWEQFLKDIEKENYEILAGLKRASQVSEIYEKYPDLLNPPNIKRIKRLLELEPQAGRKKRLRYLLEAVVERFMGSEVRSIQDALLNREVEASIALEQEASISFRDAAREIQNEPERERRKALDEERRKVIRDFSPLLAEKLSVEHGIAKRLGYENYEAMCVSVCGIDLQALDRLMQEFLRKTEDMYREVMSWTARKCLALDLKAMEKHDISHLFRGGEIEHYFESNRIVPVARRFLGDMGIDVVAGGNIAFDLEDREQKSPWAFTARLGVPEKVILVLKPRGGKGDWQTFLHELGHCLHCGFTSAEEPFEFRWFGDSSVTETYAFLFQYLLLDLGWLRRYLDFPPDRNYLTLRYLEKLYYMRRLAAKLHFELALHETKDIEAMNPVYEYILGAALGLHYAGDFYLYETDSFFYTARWLRALLFEALLSKHLCHYFDEDWYRNPRTGTFLKKHWVLGQRLTVEELVREIGYEKLTIAPLVEEFSKRL
jgi:oligoendopeptidase F